MRFVEKLTFVKNDEEVIILLTAQGKVKYEAEVLIMDNYLNFVTMAQARFQSYSNLFDIELPQCRVLRYTNAMPFIEHLWIEDAHSVDRSNRKLIKAYLYDRKSNLVSELDVDHPYYLEFKNVLFN